MLMLVSLRIILDDPAEMVRYPSGVKEPAMTALARPRMTADAFLAWAITRPKGERYELVAGEVVAMAAERAIHAETKFAVTAALKAAIAAAGLRCQAFIDGLAVRIDDETVYEPDALVRCGEPVDPDTATIRDPVIVVEVVSPASATLDPGAKLDDYFRLASVRHYLIVRGRARAAPSSTTSGTRPARFGPGSGAPARSGSTRRASRSRSSGCSRRDGGARRQVARRGRPIMNARPATATMTAVKARDRARVDRARLLATTEAEIERRIAEDPDTAPAMTDAGLASTRQQGRAGSGRMRLALELCTVETARPACRVRRLRRTSWCGSGRAAPGGLGPAASDADRGRLRCRLARDGCPSLAKVCPIASTAPQARPAERSGLRQGGLAASVAPSAGAVLIPDQWARPPPRSERCRRPWRRAPPPPDLAPPSCPARSAVPARR
jgi:Uma2 family endonuclease